MLQHGLFLSDGGKGRRGERLVMLGMLADPIQYPRSRESFSNLEIRRTAAHFFKSMSGVFTQHAFILYSKAAHQL